MVKGMQLCVMAALLACGSLTGAAQDKGYWRAASSNAGDITGDVSITNDKITIKFAP